MDAVAFLDIESGEIVELGAWVIHQLFISLLTGIEIGVDVGAWLGTAAFELCGFELSGWLPGRFLLAWHQKRDSFLVLRVTQPSEVFFVAMPSTCSIA